MKNLENPNLFLKALRENPRIVELSGRPQSREQFIGLLHQAYIQARAEALKSRIPLTEEERKLFLEAEGEAVLEWFGNLPDDVKAKLLKLAPAQHEFYKWLRDSPQFRLMVAEAYKNIMYQQNVLSGLPELNREEFYEAYMSIPQSDIERIEREIFGGIFERDIGGSGDIKVLGPGRFLTPLIPSTPKIQVKEQPKTWSEKIVEMNLPLPQPVKEFAGGVASGVESLAAMLVPKHPMTREPLIPIYPPPTAMGSIFENVKSLFGMETEFKQSEFMVEHKPYFIGSLVGDILTGMLIGKALGKLAARISKPQAIGITDYVEYRSGSMVKRALKGEVLEDPLKGVKVEDIVGVRLKAVEYTGEGLRLGVKDVLGEQFTAMLKGVKDLRVTGPEEWLDIKWSLGPIEEYIYSKILEQPTFQAITKSFTGSRIIFRDEAKIIGEMVEPRLTYGKIEGFLVREAEKGKWFLSFRGSGPKTPLLFTEQKVRVAEPLLSSSREDIIITGILGSAITLSAKPPPAQLMKMESGMVSYEAETDVISIPKISLKPHNLLKPGPLSLTLPKPSKIIEEPEITLPKGLGKALEVPIELPKPKIKMELQDKVERSIVEIFETPQIKRGGLSGIRGPGPGVETPIKISMKLNIPLKLSPPSNIKPPETMITPKLPKIDFKPIYPVKKRGKRRSWKYFEFINPFPDLFTGPRRGRKGK